MWESFWVSVVGISWKIFEWICWGCSRISSAIGGIVVLVVSCLSKIAPELTHGLSRLYFGLQLEQLHSSLFHWLFHGSHSVFPVFCTGRRFIGCIGSKLAFLCGLVCLSKCLTGWVNNFWLSLGCITVFVVVLVVFVDVVVCVRVIGNTVFVFGIISNIFSLFSLFFQQATLISKNSWFFTVVAR